MKLCQKHFIRIILLEPIIKIFFFFCSTREKATYTMIQLTLRKKQKKVLKGLQSLVVDINILANL